MTFSWYLEILSWIKCWLKEIWNDTISFLSQKLLVLALLSFILDQDSQLVSSGTTSICIQNQHSCRCQYITWKWCQPLTHSTSHIFMHNKHKDSNPQSDPAESFYGVMSSRPIVINETPHFSARLSINFQGGLSRMSPLYCALDGHEIIAMQRVARFPF